MSQAFLFLVETVGTTTVALFVVMIFCLLGSAAIEDWRTRR